MGDFVLADRGKDSDLFGMYNLFLSEGDMALLSNGDVFGEDFFGTGGVSSQALYDFLCTRSLESTNMLCRSGLLDCVGGELGGVLKFCADPGGEELGVIFCERGTGEVLLARGETGVCLLRGTGFIIFRILSLKESDL